ncbi:MAG: hypothetical protein K2F81_04590, partial [Ruminococcus sp.]|nr:hypothetical protein [Ruminococcus sp.]
DGLKLDCLRSPHLYREHPIRLNNIKECFNTNAIYISCHDLISKIVQCDYDGDKFLVTDNETIIETAERNMKNIVPLFYNMSKASDEILTPDSLFKGLLLAYNGGNIGPPSNDITKIWNSGDISEEQLTAIKWLVMEVNFIIDYSKTLYKPKRPDWANKIINQYTKEKVPRFFMYAKDKNTAQVKEKTTCVVDRIQKLFPKKKLCFNFKQDNIGKFDYRMLMSNSNAEYISEISERYKNIVSKLDFNNIDKLISTDKNLYNYFAVYENAKKEIIGKEDKFKVIDIIIYDLFYQHKSIKKKAFWTLFGDEVYKNLCKNISDSFIQCERCHKRFYKEHGRQKYCNKCSGYVKQKTKVITCCDCGEKIQTGAKDNKTCRCKDCYEIYRKKRKLETQRIRRKNAEMKSVQI